MALHAVVLWTMALGLCKAGGPLGSGFSRHTAFLTSALATSSCTLWCSWSGKLLWLGCSLLATRHFAAKGLMNQVAANPLKGML
eukprot:7358605-Prorocentrum_lima.AAC.1